MILPSQVVNIVLILCIYTVNCQNNEPKVVLVSPVLAAYKNPRARVVETAKDFPILKLLSLENTSKVNELRKEAARPIYVEKLGEQMNTQRRSIESTYKNHMNYDSAVERTHPLQKRETHGLDTPTLPRGIIVIVPREEYMQWRNGGKNGRTYTRI